jgi:hypothetical protein
MSDTGLCRAVRLQFRLQNWSPVFKLCEGVRLALFGRKTLNQSNYSITLPLALDSIISPRGVCRPCSAPRAPGPLHADATAIGGDGVVGRATVEAANIPINAIVVTVVALNKVVLLLVLKSKFLG